MRILFTFLFKNILEKKLRSILIILAIAIATAMTFASLGTSDNFKNMVIEKNRMEFGNGDLIISAKEDSKDSFIDSEKIDKFISSKNKVAIFNGSGVFKDDNNIKKVNIIASDVEKINDINPIYLENNSKNFDFNNINGNKVIVSKSFSEEFNFKRGDTFNIKIEGKDIPLKIEAIAIPKGFFGEKPGEITLVMSNEGLSEELSRKPLITSYLINTEGNKKEIEDIGETYLKDYSVKETINDETLDDMVKQFTIPFYIMLAVVVLMAAFIIYSSFKVIVIERMGVIGTFRSIGATKFSTDGLLMLESLIYGIIGSIIGGFLGVPMLYLLSDSSNQFKDLGIKTAINFSLTNMILAMVIAIILCLVSSIIPIIEVSKVPVKEIILGEYKSSGKQHPILWIIGIVFIIFPFYYIGVFKNSGSFILTLLCAFLFLIGIAIIVPSILKILSKVLKGFYRILFGNEGVLGLENVGGSKSLANNGVLLCCALAAVAAIYIASYSVKNIIVKSYSGANYDVAITSISSFDKKYIDNKLEDLKGKEISDFTNDYISYNIKIDNIPMEIGILEGVDGNKYLKFFSDEEIYDKESSSINSKEILGKLNKGNYIIMADIFQKKYKYKVGDKVNIDIDDNYYPYEIIGFLSSPISANKRNCIISEENFKKDFGKSVPTEILVKGNNLSEDELAKYLRNDFEDYPVVVKQKSQIEKAEIENNVGLMKSLESFSIMALVIGGLGIMNNLMVSFIQRKREMAVLASIGMSKTQRMKMIFVEGFTIGIVGSLIGVLSGIGVTSFVPEITLSLDTYLKIKIPKEQMLMLFILGVILVVIASFVPMFKSSKISVVKEIKYE